MNLPFLRIKSTNKYFLLFLPLDKNGPSDGPSNDVSMDGVV
jgi:hypothetical protein